MKNLYVVLFILISLSAVAQSEKFIDSEISGVLVYLQKAEISQKATTTIGSGMTDVVIQNLSQNIDPNSIAVQGLGNIVIMSVSHRLNHTNKAEKSEKVKAIESKIQLLEDELINISYNKEALQEEKSMILANKSIGGENGVNLTALQSIADFYRKKLVEIGANWSALNKREKDIQDKLKDEQNQLSVLTTSLNRPTSEIVVKVQATAQQTIKLDINYMVYNAGWTPYYDFRAFDGSNKVKVNMRANVYQNTGVDWTNVPITLSTGNPSQGVTKPELSPWRLYLQDLNVYIRGSRAANSYDDIPSRAPAAAKMEMESLSMGDLDGGSMSNAQTTADFINTEMKELSTEYTIELNQTIPSDNQQHLVQIKDFEVDAHFKHAAVPKLDKDAFLMAHLTDWQQHDWISSEIGIFYDGSFVGKSYLNVSQVEDTIALSMGRDKKVAITREKIKDYCETKDLGTNSKKTIGYEIVVRNNKKTSIQMNLQDQLPISTNEQIEVKVIDINDATHEKETGFLDWDFELKPGENRKFYIKYEVKYPAKQIVSGL